jgi:adenylate kinase
MFISLIDDVHTVYARLKYSRSKVHYSLKDIMVWREEEMIISDILASMHNCPHYVLSINYGPDIIYKLMFGKKLKKIYTSFPISLILDKPKLIAKIDKFRKWVSRHAIAFDPYCAIKEKTLHYKLQKAEDSTKKKFKMRILNKEIEFSTSDVRQIIEDIDGQIIYRDFRLIDQSDMVLAFIPTLNGKPQLSSGVERELEYGHDNGKDVYVICDIPNKLSPFLGSRCDHVFKTIDEAKQALFSNIK